MNINKTMLALYIAHERFTNLAEQLEKHGHAMAAAELVRESKALGRQLMQLEGVLGDYRIDIAAVQHQEQPCFIGVDRAAGQLAGRCFNGVDQ